MIDRNYKVRDKVVLNNNNTFKYQTPYKGTFEINQCWSNGAVTLQCDATKIWYNISRIKPYKSDTNVEDIVAKNMYDDVNI